MYDADFKAIVKEELREVLKDQKIKLSSNDTFLKLDNYMDNAEQLYSINPYFYDRSGIWWMWKTDHWEITDETDMGNLLDTKLGFYGQTVAGGVKNNYLEAMRRVGRGHQPKDAPERWIQFKEKAFSLRSGKIYPVQPNYFFCNPIPWEIGKSSETPTMDRLFKEWVGEEYVQTLYEVLAYCCFTKYPIQVLICLYGIGRNGKGCYLRLLAKFIGIENMCATDLDLIAGKNRSRFETSKMFKKLVCQMGETNFGILESSNTIKQLTGGDLMNYELKGKNGFTGYNYAKLIIASNSLPSTQDTSDGFYRRWTIIDFPNIFSEGKDIIENIPDQEYRNLAKKATEMLPGILDRGYLAKQGTIEDRKKKYTMASNPLMIFLSKYCEWHPTNFCRYSTVFAAYCKYLTTNKRRVVCSSEFGRALAAEGIELLRGHRNHRGEYLYDKWIMMYELSDEKVEKMSEIEGENLVGSADSVNSASFPTPESYIGDEVGNNELPTLFTLSSKEKCSQVDLYTKEELVEDSPPLYMKCHICGSDPCVGYDNSPSGKGRPICNGCKTYNGV